MELVLHTQGTLRSNSRVGIETHNCMGPHCLWKPSSEVQNNGIIDPINGIPSSKNIQFLGVIRTYKLPDDKLFRIQSRGKKFLKVMGSFGNYCEI